MENTDIQISRLRLAVEEKLGKKLDSPVNFSYLSEQIQTSLKEYVSVSTLKRIWGYVKYDSKPTKSVLTILARYIGYPHWDAFCKASDTGDFVESMELSDTTIFAEQIHEGDIVEFEWQPNRYCKVECLEPFKFRVLESHNGKLYRGNVFKTDLFAKGMPLYVTDLRQGEETGKAYVAGRTHGLSSLKLTPKKK